MSTNVLLEALRGLPPEIATLILGALPLAELRGALPVALLAYKMPLISSLFWSILGNMLPIYFLLVFFERFTNWLRPRSKLYDQFCTWLFERTRRKLHTQVQKYGYWALAIFVGIPLPITGAWTGAIAAFIFGMDRKKAFLAIFVGVLLAAIIVTAVVFGANATLKAIFL